MKLYDNVYMKRFLYFNLYVIKGTKGDILIDTGFMCMKRSIKKWLDNFNIKLIILTHAHVDHVYNVSYIKKLYNCEVAMGINDISNLDNSIINSKPKSKGFGLWTYVMNFGMKHIKYDSFDIDIKLKDKQVIRRYGIYLKIFDLPGHTNGSIGIKYKDYLFVGDALVKRGKYPTIAFQNQDLESAKVSARVINDIKPNIIFLGHDKPFSFDKFDINKCY